MDFVHPVLNEEIDAIGGYYMFTKENLMEHPHGNILYLIGFAATDTSCCGAGGCGYAVVAGHVQELHSCLSKEGRYISEVTPVDEQDHAEITRALRMKEGISQVHFLLTSGGEKVMY